MKNVLLVDDDAISNLLNAKAVEQTGISANIHTALNGEAAINLINEYFQGTTAIPEIILLDLNMPVMDGFTFISAFRNLGIPGMERVKIIIVTSSNNPKDRQKAAEMGIVNFLTKPISADDIRRELGLI